MEPASYTGSLHSRSILRLWNESETLSLTSPFQPDVKTLYSIHFASLALYKVRKVSQITVALHLCYHTLVEALEGILLQQDK